MKRTNSFACRSPETCSLALLLLLLAAGSAGISCASAGEDAPAAPAPDAAKPVAEAPAPAPESPPPAAPPPASETPKPATEAPAPAAEAPKPAEAPPAPEAPKPATEAPAPAAEAPKPAETPPAAEAPKPATETPAPAAEAPKPAETPPAPTPEPPKPAAEVAKPAPEAPAAEPPAPASKASKRTAEASAAAADTGTSDPEKRLRFNFRYQRWSDVLEWFAEQADLSLVLDAPPPGTFNYSDSRDYSVSESLDLLNSVLLTKGYTLIRRERMLTLIDLSGEFPESLIPKVTIEEAEKRGKHELVTVEFTLGGRDPIAAVAAVEPLLGPYHTILPVVPTRQLFVTDRAGVMPNVQKVVQSLPEPKAPPTPPTPPKPEPKELKVYPIDVVDTETQMQLLKELVSGVQFIVDPNLNQMHANATAAQHAQIQAVLDQVKAAAASATDRERRVELYELPQPVTTTAATTKLTEMFKALVPKALVSLKEDGTAVIAWASPAEHETIRATMDKLGGGPVGDPVKTPQLEIYRLTRVDPTKLITMLEKLVPDAKLSYDERSRSLIALAKPGDQQAIRATLLQVQTESETPGADQPRFETYDVRAETAAALDAMTAQVQPLVPEAKISADAKTKRLVVYGTTAEQQLVKSSLEKLGLDRPASDGRTVEIYPLSGADLTATQTLLAQMVPLAEFTADAAQQRLIAVASAADHERIKSTLEKLRPNPADPEAAQLKFYPFEETPPADVLDLLAKVAPQAKITVDKERERLLVLAPPTSQTAVELAFQQFQQATPAAKPELATYPITASDPTSLVTMLTTRFPQAQIALDTPNKRLLVWASTADQAAVAATIEKLEAEPAADQQPRFESYPLFGFATAAEAGTLVTSLQSLVPNARFTIDSKVKNLIVWATEKEHQTVAKALERLGQGPAPQNTPQLEVHRLVKANADTTLALLQKVVPDAQLTLDAKTSSLIALAVPADQQLIRSTLEQLQPGASGAGGAPAVRFHPLADEPAEGLLNILKEMVPNAQITADAPNKRLIAVATAADHDAIQKIIEQFETSTPPEEPRKLVVYPVTAAQKKRFQAVLPTLQTDMPGLQVLTDDDPGSLTIWARPSEQLKIAELVKQLEQEAPETEQLQLATYTCAVADPTTISTFLTSLFPDAKFVVDAKSRRVLVWARAQDHAKIKPALEQLGGGSAGDFELQLQSYSLSKITPEIAVPILQQQLPEAKILPDAKSGRILAWASKADHATIAQAIDQLQAGADDKHKPQLVVYPRGDADPQTLVLMLTSLVPTARVAVDAQTGGLAAWAAPEDQETIRKAIEEMSKAEVTASKPSTKAYALQNITAAAALPVLTAAVPTAKVSAGADASQVVAVAQPRDQQMLAAILKEIDVEGAAGTKSSVVIYRLEYKSSSTSVMYALNVFRSAFPNANFTLGADPGEFVAWASAKDHAGIQALVDRLNTPPAPEHVVKVALYPLKSITAASALTVLQAAMPRATFTADPADPQRLTASARPSEHENIKTILAEIDVEGQPGSQPSVVVYKLEGTTAASSLYYSLSVFRTAFPKATFSTGTEANQFVAWATEKDHAGIKAMVDQLNAAPAPEDTPQVALYTLQSITAASATTVLQAAVPKATITTDPADPQRLTVLARPADQEKIAAALAKIDVEGEGGGRPQVVVYQLERQTSPTATSYAISLLTQAFPRARFLLGTEIGQVVAWASAKDHTDIKDVVDRLNAGPPPEEAPEPTVYSLQHITAASAITLLTSAVPKAKLTPDTEDTRRLTAFASPVDQAAIKNILEKIDVAGDPTGGATVGIYKLEGATAATSLYYTLSVFRTAFPKATFSTGTEANQFVAWATEKDHAGIKAMVDQLNAAPAPEDTPQVALYTLQSITAASATTVLQAAVPKATITADPADPQRLTVLARPADQEKIAAALAKIDVEGEGGGRPQVVVYQLERQASPTATSYAISLLTQAFPRARFLLGTEVGQFVAWASARDHTDIKDVVDRLNAGPPPEEAPVATVYSTKNILAAAALSVLTAAVPMAKLTPDTQDTRRLTAYASPADQATIKEILAKIDVEGEAAGATVAVYQLDGTPSIYTLILLRNAFPQVTFSGGAEPGQFVAFANAKEHAGIKALVDQINTGPPADQKPQIALYTLKSITNTSAAEALRAAVPKAVITVDTGNAQRLTASARPADHEAIKSILAIIDVEGDPAIEPSVAVYKLERQTSPTATSYAISLLTQAFPKARFLQGTEVGQFVAWASAKDQEKIQAVVDRLNAAPPPEEAPVATVYSMKNILATTALNVLTTAVPMAKLTPDTQDTRRLTAYASPADQATITEILAKIDVEGDAAAAATAVVYQLEGQPSTTSLIYTLILLRNAFPNVTFSGGAEAGQFVAFANAKDHAGIKALVDQINTGPPADQKPQVALYTLKSITNTSAAEVLRAAVPKAVITVDTANLQRLTASARAADHEAIKSILAIIDVEGDPAIEPSVAVYTLERQASPTATSYAISLLTQAFPKARFLPGTEIGQFVAWASANDHTDIKAVVDRLNAAPPPDEAPLATVYSLQHILATTALTVLTPAVPKAKLTPDTEDTRRLTAYASPADQATIKQILAQIDIEGDPAAGQTVAVYLLEGQATASSLYYTLAVFRSAFPKATFSVGADAGQFVAWASAKEHEGIKALVEQMNAGPPLEQKPQVALYTLKFITGTAAAEVLRTAVPKATFTIDPDDPQRLTASARTADHEAIKKVLEEIDVEGEGGGRSTVQVYTLLGKQADTAMTYAFRLLTTAFPRARISLGTEPNQFVAWASPRDHQEIKALVDRLNAAPPPDEAQKAVVYSLKNITATTAMTVLRSAVPRANLTADTTDPQRLTAYATPAEHATIKEIVAQIDAESDPDASYTVAIYTLEGMSTRAIYYAGVFLAQVVPQAKFTPGAEEAQMVVWASAKDHAQIKKLIDQLQQAPPPEVARKIVVYTLQNITGEAALAVLPSAVRRAELSVDPADPQRINAWASPADHTTIADILKQLDVKADPASAATAAVYQLEGMGQTAAFYALRFLRDAVPKANIALGAEGGQIVVWARAQDHEVIKGLVKQLVEESPDALRTAKVYSLQHATATTALQTLTPVVPRASLSLGSDPSQLIAFARPLDHTKIAEIIKQLDGPPPPETEPSAVVYTLQSGNAMEAMRIIRTAVPQANLSAGAEPHQLIAWARPTDHKIIAQVVERMAEKGPADMARKVVVYTIESGDATTAMTLLRTALPGAEFSVGSDPRRLIAWATPADHEAIKKSVDEIQAGAAQLTSQVYRFRYGDPKTALTVLTPLVPAAKMAVDADEGTLVVSALPEDHQKIKATIDQMDGEGQGGQRPALKVHPVSAGSVANAFRSLTVLFRDDPTVQLSLDLDNDSVLAVASAAKQERITEMLKALEDAARQDAQATLELYSLRNVDAESAQEILQQMLDKQGSKADLTLDELTNQLVAIARPEVQEQIAKLLEQLRGPEAELEIYDLKYVDPYSAEMAIFRQFDDDALAPDVSTDSVTQQLFIRATPEQQQKIRELLIKMGETGLSVLGGRSSQNMRTVPFQGDPKAALEEIRKIWPKLRENEIRVVSPDQPLPPPAAAPAPSPKKSSSWRPTPHAAPEFAAVIERLWPFAAFALPTQLFTFQPAEPPDDKPLDEPSPPPDEPAKATATVPAASAAAGPPATVSPPAAAPASPPADTPAPGAEPPPVAGPEPAAVAPAAEPPAAPAPIYVVPGDGAITVVCDDAEALEQFEKLLRAMSGTSGEVGRNISVFNLKHSNAVEIAEKLRDLYESRRSSWRLGATEVNIVPDERMNRILVQGSRIDRETIESLVRVLDTEQGTASKPQIVPIRFAEATEVAQVVQDVFRSQMTRSASGYGNGPRSSALSRVTPEVAVDPATNSLIVMAPSPLLDEILKLISSLDQAAEENPARRLKIIALQKTNTTRVEDALQRILKSGPPRPRPAQ